MSSTIILHLRPKIFFYGIPHPLKLFYFSLPIVCICIGIRRFLHQSLTNTLHIASVPPSPYFNPCVCIEQLLPTSGKSSFPVLDSFDSCSLVFLAHCPRAFRSLASYCTV